MCGKLWKSFLERGENLFDRTQAKANNSKFIELVHLQCVTFRLKTVGNCHKNNFYSWALDEFLLAHWNEPRHKFLIYMRWANEENIIYLISLLHSHSFLFFFFSSTFEWKWQKTFSNSFRFFYQNCHQKSH